MAIDLDLYLAELNRRRVARSLAVLCLDRSSLAETSQQAAEIMARKKAVEHPRIGECVIAGATWEFSAVELWDEWSLDFPHWSWLYSPSSSLVGIGTASGGGWFYWAATFNGSPSGVVAGAPPTIARPVSWLSLVGRFFRRR
jgi:hypothetical protein